MVLRYGFLQGTFGLPYGGYCVRPFRLNDIMLDADNPGLSMFCVLGKYCEVLEWLEGNDRMVANLCTTQDTFTHDLTVEVYDKASTLSRVLRGRGSIDVQLVIRIARTWDRDAMYRAPKAGPLRQFRPLLKVLVPSGVTLSEIKAELERAEPHTLLDDTRNKNLLDVVLTRVSTRGSVLSSDARAPLPSYQRSIEQPPRYTE
ncbi:hypothetical protein LPJ59_004271 [Coemansia sp. RSA 2399]|nr:hypothetical protein LPJ59_004271 [Coemansia sp. RSA 2399]KAJ1900188.1 hypothetical protein LPJ81_003994 [Coemansia sp. IMI 209127]